MRILLLALLIVSVEVGASGLRPCYNHPFGLMATEASLQLCPSIFAWQKQAFFERPSVQRLFSASKHSLRTLNGMGFDVVTANVKRNWLSDDLVAFIRSRENATVIDIGAGFGGLTKKTLMAGSTTVYNDIHIPHLEAGYELIPKQYHQQLIFNSDRFPNETDFPKESFDAVILHRVIALLTPAEMDAGLKKAWQWLKPGGQIFMVGFAPQHKRVRGTFLGTYEKGWQQGNPWPGYPLVVEKHLPDQADALPKVIHAMDGRALEAALKRHGFSIIRSDFISMQHLPGAAEEFVRDGKEHYGVVGAR